MLSVDEVHAAFLAGYDLGYAHRRDDDIEDAVAAVLHHRALKALGLTRAYSSLKGPAWLSMMEAAT